MAPSYTELPQVEAVRPHVSPSSLDTFCKCPEQWRRRYIEKEKIPPGVAAYRGRGIHQGARLNFKQKIESRRDLPAKDIVDAAVATFEAEMNQEGYMLTPEEKSRGATVVVSEELDSTARLARAFAQFQAPEYQPLLVEERITIELPNASHDIIGFLDLLDDQNRVDDFKTAKRKKSQGDVDNSVQLTVYAAGAFVRTGVQPTVRLDVLVDKKGGVERQVLNSTRGLADYKALAARTSAVLFSIGHGAFPPALPGSWWCSPKWCGYWSTCPYVNAERTALAAGDE